MLPLLGAPIKTSFNPMEHTLYLPYKILPLEYTVLDALPLWNPPSVEFNHTKFYFPQSNIRVEENMFVINNSYPELLFKANSQLSYVPCLQASEPENLTLRTGKIEKSITLKKNQQIIIGLPIKPILQIDESNCLYKLGIFFSNNNKNLTKSVILKINTF